jgi:hypothetical protein
MFGLILTFTLIQLDTLSVPKPVGVVTDYVPAQTIAVPAYVPAQTSVPKSSDTIQNSQPPSASQLGAPTQTFVPAATSLSPDALLKELQEVQTNSALTDVVRRVTGVSPSTNSLDRVLLYTPSTTLQTDALTSSTPTLQGDPTDLRSLCTRSDVQLFPKNIRLGDSGPEVVKIQKFLNAYTDTKLAESGAGSPSNETELFSSKTFSAVKKFQTMYASDILVPLGLVRATGEWGPKTRAKATEVLCK